MKQITLNVPNNEYTFLMKVLRSFNFVKIEKTKTIAEEPQMTNEQKEWVEGLKSALEEVRLHEEGKIQLKPARELLNEL